MKQAEVAMPPPACARCWARTIVGPCLIEDHEATARFISSTTSNMTTSTLKDRNTTVTWPNGTPINVPMNYYPSTTTRARKPLNRWRSHAHLLYGNWVNEIYQTTPFDINDIGR